MTLEQIEVLAKEHAADRAELAERVTALNDEIDGAKRRKLSGIKAAVSKAKDSRVRLEAAIDGSRDLFAKPKTRVFHGIKLGLQKAKGKVTFADAKRVVELIKKYFADQEELLIKTTEKPVKAALANLAVADLKRLGCEVSETGDAVLIQAADSEVDKLVDALLGDGSEDEEEDE